MEQIGVLETICRYPVKSMAGIYAAVLREGVVRQGDPIYLA